MQRENYFLTETEARKDLEKEIEERISNYETQINRRLKLLDTMKNHVKYDSSDIKEVSKAAHLLQSLMYTPFSDDFNIEL